ncbi:MAG: hypothetical protein ACLGI8_02445 [Acidimicrobiia bacterium]
MGEAQQGQAVEAGPDAGPAGAPPTAPVEVSAFRAARQLLDEAEAAAASIVAEAERRARSREREADLLVAKARRLLEAAEAKAAVVLSEARAAAAVLDLTDAGPGRVVAPGATVLPRGSLADRIDEIVASAVAQAVDEARPRSGALGSAS